MTRLIPKLQRFIGECKGGSEGKVKLARGSGVGKGRNGCQRGERTAKEGEVGKGR